MISRAHAPALQAACLLTCVGLSGACNAEAHAREPKAQAPIRVESAEVRAQDVPRLLRVVGTLRALREADVTIDASGVVTSTNAELGDYVKQGAVLVQLDARSARLHISESSLRSASALAQQSQAERECARSEQLFAVGSVPRAELERNAHRCEVLATESQLADVRASVARKNLHDTVLRAPFAGRVAERLVSVGEFVAPPRVAVRLVEDSSLWLVLAIPETESAHVQPGSAVQFSVPALPERTFHARVTRLAPTVRRDTGDLIVEALVDNREGSLRAGMVGSAAVAVGTLSLPSVPSTALLETGDSSQLFVVRDGALEQRVVRTGYREGALVSIADGLSVGEHVVTRIEAHVRDGARVQ